MAGILIAACAEQPAVRLSVRGSALLGEYANPPLWVWTVDHGAAVAAVEASLDGGPFRYLHPAARSFRPARPLAPGRHTLTIRVTTAGAFAAQAEASAAASVAALPGAPPVPDDPCFPPEPVRCGDGRSGYGQWALRQIRLPEVWQALAAGELRAPRSVVVAVLDTGYRPHPELVASLDRAAGYDFVSNDRDAADPGDTWHGTAVAGIIAAQADDGAGVAGMGWPWGGSRIRIVPVRVLESRGAGSTWAVAQGLLYAAGMANASGTLPPAPAKIINLSLAGPPHPGDAPLEEALRRVTAAGAIVVAAAGNTGGAVSLPANSPHTLAVGSVDARGSRVATSDFGPELDVVAPGGADREGIWTLDGPSRGSVRTRVGTSMAAAHVSGVLALLAGLDPSITLGHVRAMLADSALDLGAPGRDDRFGAGLLDAFALFGAWPARAGARLSSARVPYAVAAEGHAAPGDADPHSLIVRFSGDAQESAGAEAGERLLRRHALAGVTGVEAGGGYALVRLRAGQDRARIKARLEADPAVAAVHDNRIYRRTDHRTDRRIDRPE